MSEPLEQQLIFDISAALGSIDTLDSALSAVVGNFESGLTSAVEALTSLTIAVDTSAIEQDVAAALATVSEPIAVEADTSDLASGIADATDQAHTVEVDGDTSALTDAVEASVSSETISVDGDTTGLTEAIDTATTGIDATVPVDGDPAALSEAIEQALTVDATIPVDADTSAASEAIDALNLAEPVVAVSADTDAAQAEIDQIGVSAVVDIPVTADVSAAEADIEQVGANAEVVLPVSGDTSDLEASIDDATAVVPVIDVGGDAAELAAAIEDATAVSAVVPVDADVSAAQDAIGGLEGETVTISVEADTGGAEDAISGVGTSAGGASSQVGDLTSAMAGFGAVAKVGQGEVSGLSSGVQALGGNAAIVGSAVIAGGVTLGYFFGQAVQAQAAVARLNSTFGPLASNIENLRIGDLNADLSTLALSLGSDDDALRNIASTLFLFQTGAGTSREEASKFSETVLALSARAVALNPALGRAEDIAGRLGNTLGRGGRFASAFQISLSQVDIKARAAENAAKGLGDGVSFASLQLAGGQLALERYGDHLDEDIAKGTENPIIQLRALRQAFEEAAEEIGQPLIAPIFDILTSVEPIAVSVARAIGALGEVALPVLNGLIDLLAPVTPLLSAFADGASAVGDVLDAIPGPLLAVAEGLGILSLAALGAADSLIALALTPLGATVLAIGAGITALGFVMHQLGGDTKDVVTDTEGLAGVFSAAAVAAGGLDDALAGTTASIDAYLRKQLAIKTEGVSGVEIISLFGASFGELDTILQGSTDAFEHWFDVTRASRDLTDDEREANKKFSEVLVDARDRLDENAAATLAGAVADKILTQAQVDYTIEQTRAESGTRDNITALKVLTPTMEQATRATDSAALSAAVASGAFADIARGIASGSLTAEAATQRFTELGVSLPIATENTKALGAAFDAFVASGLSALPDAGAALDDFATDIASAQAKVAESSGKTAEDVRAAQDELVAALDPQRLIDAQAKQNFEILAFQQKLGVLLSRGLDDTVAQLVAEGPQKGASVAAALVDDAAAGKAYEGGLELGQKLTGGYTTFLEDHKDELAGKTVTLANGQVVALTDAIAAGVVPVAAAAEQLSSAAAEHFRLDLTGHISASTQAAADALSADQSIGQAAGEKGLAALAAFEEKYGPVPLAAAVQIALGGARKAIEVDPTLAAASGAKGKEASEKFKPDIKGKAAEAFEEAAALIPGLSNVPNVAGLKGVEAGQAFGQGLANGLDNKADEVAVAASALGAIVERSVRAKQESKSPSQVAVRIGQDFTRGLAIGLGDTGILADAGSAVGTAIATAGTAAISSVIEGFNDQATTSNAIATLRKLIDEAQASTATTAAQSQAQSSFASFVSSVVSQFPGTGAAISKFSSDFTAALTAQSAAFDKFDAAGGKYVEAQHRVQATTGQTAAAFGRLTVAKDAYNRKFAETPKDASDAQKAALKVTKDTLDEAQRAFDALSKRLRSATDELSTTAHALRSTAGHAVDAQDAVAGATNPDRFTQALNAQTAVERKFRDNLRTLVQFGDTDLAEELARAGADAAGKLAAGFASSKSKARAGEAAVDNAAAFADSYEAFLEKQFAPKVEAATAIVGEAAGNALVTGLRTSLQAGVGAALNDLRDKILEPTFAVRVDTSAVTSSVQVDPKLTFRPETSALVGLPQAVSLPQAVQVQPINQTVELDLTIVMPDGETVHATSVLPIPQDRASFRQRVMAEIHA